jgi:hypothetical protein
MSFLFPVVVAALSASALPASSHVVEQLPQSIIADGQWIVADMDGTLIGAPGYKKEPTLEQSAAKEDIFNWLRAGGQLLVLTGCETERTISRFARFIPQDLNRALIERRLLFGTNGGSVLCYYDGSRWTEDVNFLNTAIDGKIAISQQDVKCIVEQGREAINRFYKTLYDDPQYIADRLPESQAKNFNSIIKIASENPNGFSEEELTTLNPDVVPRIEVRKAENANVVQIALIGIPVDLNYDISDLRLKEKPGIKLSKVGMTHEINVTGVDKALIVRWLQEERAEKIGYPKFQKEKSLAVGDRPNHNDAPLTTAVGSFVSVCERDNPQYIPEHVKLKIGKNEAGTAELLRRLLLKAEEFLKNDDRQPVIPATVEAVVKESLYPN